MNPEASLIHPSGIEQPRAGVDWRLLLPITEQSKILVIGRSAEDIAAYLKPVGINADFLPSHSVLTEEVLAPHPDLFDVVAVPLGFSRSNLNGRQGQARVNYSLLHRLLRPAGTLLIGFSNRLCIRRRALPKDNFSAIPAQMIRSLKQANFQSIQLYGVLTRLQMPRYIFPASNPTIRFALENRFKHRVPDLLLHGLTRPVMLSVFANLLPSYFVTAST